MTIWRLTRLVTRLEQPATTDEHRSSAVARGALSALGRQGFALLASLIAVPLAIGYLGAERYGAWVTITCMLAWVSIGDLGFGNELTNSLPRALSRDDTGQARELVSTAFWTLAFIAAGLLLTGALFWRLLNWPALLSVHSTAAVHEVAPAALVGLVLFCLSFPFSLTDRILTSLQKGELGNAWGVATSFASLMAIVATTHSKGGLVALVAATLGATLLVRVTSAGWLFRWYRPELCPTWSAVKRSAATHLLMRGKDFFLVQIAALVLYSTDNIIIARVLGADHVTPYAIAWRLFTIPNVVLTAAFPYLWAAYAEALARGDLGWLLKTLRRSTGGATAFAAAVTLPLVIFGQGVIRIWAGPEAVPPWPVLAWMGVWSMILAPAASAICLLNAAGKVAWQVRAGLLAAVANVLLSVWWARAFGIAGVIAATVVSYIAIVAVPLTFACTNLIRALSNPTAREGRTT